MRLTSHYGKRLPVAGDAGVLIAVLDALPLIAVEGRPCGFD